MISLPEARSLFESNRKLKQVMRLKTRSTAIEDYKTRHLSFVASLFFLLRFLELSFPGFVVVLQRMLSLVVESARDRAQVVASYTVLLTVRNRL